MASHSEEEESAFSDKKEPIYTDAFSLPASSTADGAGEQHNLKDCDEAPVTVTAETEEAGSSRSTSASSCSSYVDAKSTVSPSGTLDSPYVDALSTAGTLPSDAQQMIAGSRDTADMSKLSRQPQSSAVHQQDQHRVYFELEKTPGTGQDAGNHAGSQTPHSRLKGQTLAAAKVNVAQRAKMFEGVCPNGKRDAAAKDHGTNQDVNYDVPPALQTEPQTSGGHGSPSDENIYEIQDQSDPASMFQSSGEGSGVYEVIEGKSRTLTAKPAIYELAGPVADQKRISQTLPNTGNELSGSGGFISCKQGSVRQDKVPGVVPTQAEIETEYNRLQFGRNSNSKPLPEEAGYDTLKQLSATDPSAMEPVYDCPDNMRTHGEMWGSGSEWSDGTWGSSEFEDDDDGYLAEPDTPAPTKQLPKKPRGYQFGDNAQKLPGLLNRLKPSSNVSNSGSRTPPVGEESDAVCLTVTINTSKHPPPELPPPPAGLSENQKKCRLVVELTISSERSYIESLERIVQGYERSILEVIPNPKSYVRAVFRNIKEILNHHKMFQIELSETVRNWDSKEKIGDIFTASFSKSMLVDAYSVYVNNFAAGMDEIRTMQQSRPSFDEFLKMKEKSSNDRLSIFGLMVKPVQRFPQFIMVLQDLIKYTPRSHHDRQALQLALTELENVTHKLNERKRLSEQYFQAKQIMQLLPKGLPSQALSSRNLDKQRRLIRFDNFDQIDGEMDNMKSSSRRLFLMDDMLVCVKVGIKDQDGFMMERFRLKWAVRLCDVELKDTAMTPDMQNVVKMDSNRLRAITSQMEQHGEDPFLLYSDLRDMLHDLSVFGQITGLMKSLRRSYQGYNMSEELFHEATSDLQKMIQIKDEQLRLVNSCSIILVDNSKTDKPHYVMQTQTASVKNEWCVDFNMARLALEKQNKPGWDRSPLAGSDDLEPAPALFMKCVPVDVPRNFTKVKCAIPVFMPSMPHVNGVGVQHLWVCTSTSSRGQVSVVSLHNTRPALTESFKACDCEVLCVEVVSGCGPVTEASRFLFSEDTVWMANTHNEIIVFPLSSCGGGSTATRDPLAVVRIPGRVTSIKFVDERLFCGLDSGVVMVYSRNDAGEWCITTGRRLELGQSPIKCQLLIRDDLWIACGHHVYVIEIDTLQILASHKLSSDQETTILQMVRCGVGVWVAFQHSAAVRLFHVETMENLQDMSVANIVNRVLTEKSGLSESRDCVVTCITSSTGLLWIGTSEGVILTLPLPRLSDGVPLYSGRPSVAYHAHRGPVRFVIPVYFSGSILELHKNSSLRSQLRARPSLRNRKREHIELKGVAEEDKLLSSGTELEAAASQVHFEEPGHFKEPGDRRSTGAEMLPPKHPDVPERMKDSAMKSPAGRKFLRRFRDSKRDGQTSTFKGTKKLTSSGRRSKSRSLSFRSELANRIKGQFQSMFDLRSDDALEVKMLYENLLDVGEISEEDVVAGGAFDDLSIRSDSAALEDSMFSSTTSLPRLQGKAMESLDLAGLSVDDAGPPSIFSASSSSTVSTGSKPSKSSKPKSKPRMKVDIPAPLPPPRQPLADHLSPPPSPRISTIRANTMRKTSASNAVMVLSGGDGYWDMHTGGNFSRNEDASLLFWIYKF